jgi:hypothetical protein
MNNLQFNINWGNINNPYIDTTNYEDQDPDMPPPSMVRLRRTFREHYTLQDIVDRYVDYDLNYAGTFGRNPPRPVNSIELYNNINKFILDVNDEMEMKDSDYDGNLIDKYTPAEKAAINLDLTQDISDRILDLMDIEPRQSLIDTYILIYSSLPLVLTRTPINRQILIQTIETLLNDGQSLINVNPLILPLYNGIENMSIETIDADINYKLHRIYRNRAFMIDCLETRYNMYRPDLNNMLINPLVNIILDYEFLNLEHLKSQILNIENANTWRQTDIRRALNINIDNERTMRLYTLKMYSNFLQNI